MKDLFNRMPSNEAIFNVIAQLTDKFLSFIQTPEGLAYMILIVVIYFIYKR